MESSGELFSVYDCPCGVTASLEYVSTTDPQMHVMRFKHMEMVIDTTFASRGGARPVDLAALVFWRICLNMQSRGMFGCYEFWTKAYDVMLLLQADQDREEGSSSLTETLLSAMSAPVGAGAPSTLTPLRY